MATGVVLFHRPSHTSPNWPWPICLIIRRVYLGISHWSCVLYDKPCVSGLSVSYKRKIERWTEYSIYHNYPIFVYNVYLELWRQNHCCKNWNWQFYILSILGVGTAWPGPAWWAFLKSVPWLRICKRVGKFTAWMFSVKFPPFDDCHTNYRFGKHSNPCLPFLLAICTIPQLIAEQQGNTRITKMLSQLGNSWLNVLKL